VNIGSVDSKVVISIIIKIKTMTKAGKYRFARIIKRKSSSIQNLP